jgi:hypothetical protein
MISYVFTAAAALASFNCQLESPRAIGFDGDKATASEIGLPPMARAFSIVIEDGNPKQARVSWPNDPMQMSGKFPAVVTAPGSFAFSAYSSGPCLFTEQACLAQFNLVGTADGSANLIVTPVALATSEDRSSRNPFAVVARGQCKPSGQK